jgi:hypothetical protein
MTVEECSLDEIPELQELCPWVLTEALCTSVFVRR